MDAIDIASSTNTAASPAGCPASSSTVTSSEPAFFSRKSTFFIHSPSESRKPVRSSRPCALSPPKSPPKLIPPAPTW
jgi:hypothetical protein